MARQEGIFMLTGPVGNLSFYKTQGGYFVRRKSGVSGKRIMTEPAYARTRENIAEFRRSTLSMKLFRSAFRALVTCAADNRVAGRLTGAMVKVIQGDAVNQRGQRNVRNGTSSLLEGFQFNKNISLTKAFSAPFAASIHRDTGHIIIDIPAFVPAQMVCSPAGATHFCLKSGGAAIDFEANTYSVATCDSTDISLMDAQHQLKLNLRVTAGSADPMFVVFGIEFLQLVNGHRYPLSKGAFNAMAIVKVDRCTAPGVLRQTNISAVRSRLPFPGRKSIKDHKPKRFDGKPVKYSVQERFCAHNPDPLHRFLRTTGIEARAG